MFIPSVFRDDSFPLGVVRMDPQNDMGLHHHPYVELVLTRAGSGTHLAGDQDLPLRAGDVFVIPPGLAHGYARTSQLHLVNVCFDPIGLGLPQARLSRLPGYQALFAIEPRLRARHGFAGHLHLGPEELAPLLSRSEELDLELEQRAPGHDLQGIALLQQLVIQLSRIYQQRRSDEAADLLRLGELLARIDRHLGEALSVDRLAQWAAVSPATLQRSFRSRFGCTVMDYLTGLRLDRARELLLRTELPIATIAGRIGVGDPNYFSRLFKRRVGQSPRSFRHGHRSS